MLRVGVVVEAMRPWSIGLRMRRSPRNVLCVCTAGTILRPHTRIVSTGYRSDENANVQGMRSRPSLLLPRVPRAQRRRESERAQTRSGQREHQARDRG